MNNTHAARELLFKELHLKFHVFKALDGDEDFFEMARFGLLMEFASIGEYNYYFLTEKGERLLKGEVIL